MIRSGCNTGGHMIRHIADACCYQQEIPDSQSRGWYRRFGIDVSFLMPLHGPYQFLSGVAWCDVGFYEVAEQNPVL